MDAPKPALAESFRRYPQALQESGVRNFGVDYIALRGSGDLSFIFLGGAETRFADVVPYSGDFFWWSNRADDSNMRLTRAFDLSTANAGDDLRMQARMWFDIEGDYDYGYVLASRDGNKWDILPGQRTTTTNPSGNSFGHAYTSKSAGLPGDAPPAWTLESFDLSAYAGEEILVRFEYVTDDAVNAPAGSSTTSTFPPSATSPTSRTARTAGRAKAGC